MNSVTTSVTNTDGSVTTTVVTTYDNGTTSTVTFTVLGGGIQSLHGGGDGP